MCKSLRSSVFKLNITPPPKPCPLSPIWRKSYPFLNAHAHGLWLAKAASWLLSYVKGVYVVSDPLISASENKLWKADECEALVAATCVSPSLPSDLVLIFFNRKLKSLEQLFHTWGVPHTSDFYISGYFGNYSFHSPLFPTLLLLKSLSHSYLRFSGSLIFPLYTEFYGEYWLFFV